MSDLEEHLDGLSIEERSRIGWHIRKIAAARESLPAFFEYVVREEISQKPVKTLPHQRVHLKFIKQHPRCVCRLPVGFSKSFLAATDLLDSLGRDPTMRAAVISAAAEQAKKVLSMVRAYIEESPELRLVYPKLTQTKREGEPWTQSAITVDRPYGIRDPSLVAVGVDSLKIPGSRLKKIVVDDILNKENTATPEQREQVKSFFKTTVLSRRDAVDASITVINTPWDRDDLTYWLEEKLYWPTLTMDSYGDIRISNTDFDCEDIRPAHEIGDGQVASVVRLTAHDDPTPDTDLTTSLWPERYPLEKLEEIRTKDYADSPLEWAQTMRCKAISDESMKVKREWVQRAQRLAKDLGFEKAWKDDWGGGQTFTGVDLAIGKNKRNDLTCFFTIHVDELGRRIVLDVDAGRWSGTEILARLTQKHKQFGSIIRIETNAAQMWMKEFALEVDPSLPIRSHNTGKNKSDVNFGLEMVFTDIENGLWAIPTGDEQTDEWIKEMYSYDPDKHTGDRLMASWLAREQARQSGAFARVRARRNGNTGSPIGLLLAR